MKVTTIGTANPTPQLERNTTCLVVSVSDDTVMIDCGLGALYGFVEQGIDFAAIEDVFFTHHHIDHNASFFYWAIYSWFLGRTEMTVYGPDGTEDLLQGLESVYGKHIESWRTKSEFAPDTEEGLDDVTYRRTTPDLRVERPDWRATALPVEHHMKEAFAYRFDELSTGSSVVFSGDTTKVPELGEFAAGADVLVHECNNNTPGTLLDEEDVPDRYTEPPFQDYFRSKYNESMQAAYSSVHATPREAAEVAADAAVDTLVLTHHNPYRDTAAIQAAAEAIFEGDVIVAEDGLTLSPGER